MIASFILSRTLTPTMAAWLLRGQVAARDKPAKRKQRPGIFTRFQAGFEARFSRFRERYRIALVAITARCRRFVVLYLGCALASLLLLFFVGQDFFPGIKSGEIDMHMRAPIGTRIEETGKIAVLAEQQIRDLLPGHVVGTLVNCGLPTSGINQAYSNTGTVGAQDCDITISLDNQAAPVEQLSPDPSCGSGGALSRHRLHFPAGRYYREDPEFRSALADRHSGRWPRSRGQFRLCHQAGGATEADRRHRRRPHPAGHGPADSAAGVPAQLRAGDGLDRGGYRRQCSRHPVGKRPSRTNLLARHIERYFASGQRPDPAEPARQHQRP